MLHGIVVLLLLFFFLFIAFLPFVLLLALVQILVFVGVHNPHPHKAPTSLTTELTQGRRLLLLPLGSLLDNTAKFTKEITLRNRGHAVALLMEPQIATITIDDFIHLRLELLLMANDATIFPLGTVSHGACRYAPCSWRNMGGRVRLPGDCQLVAPIHLLLLALVGNVRKVVFLFYAIPFCLDAVCVEGFVEEG
jgi:hypothetical protein